MIHAILILVWIRVLALLPDTFDFNAHPAQQISRSIVAIIIVIALLLTLPELFGASDTPAPPGLGY